MTSIIASATRMGGKKPLTHEKALANLVRLGRSSEKVLIHVTEGKHQEANYIVMLETWLRFCQSATPMFTLYVEKEANENNQSPLVLSLA